MTTEFVPLDSPKPVLLEASAGTGKTYRSEGLVVRLVAEARIPVERLLIITFTKAATADLRRRVRGRLVAARDALRSGAAPSKNDDVVERLLGASEENRSRFLAHLDTALRDFDRAAISTIHSFCQRMLQQLAFEADQEPGLDVRGDADDLVEEILADTWADAYANADSADVALFGDLGWTQKNLADLVGLMTAPAEPRLEPELDGTPLSLAEVCRRWRDEVAAFQAWLKGTAGRAAIAALRNDASKSKDKILKGVK